MSLKSTMLRSGKSRKNLSEENIASLEDPIEMVLGDFRMVYANGRWTKVVEGQSESVSELAAQAEIERLLGENRLLELKTHVLAETLAITNEEIEELEHDHDEMSERYENWKEKVRKSRQEAMEGKQGKGEAES